MPDYSSSSTSPIFILCDKCYWCATYVNKSRRPVGNFCPRCNIDTNELTIVTVNNVVVSDPRVPFGGVKNSGFGRVIQVAMLEFVNIKSVRFYDQLIYEHHVK
jgi:hypothetical protein